jgi:hypothetical protein
MKNTQELEEQKKRINAHIVACWHRYAESNDGKEIDRVIALEQVLATINNGLEIGWAGYKLWEALQENKPKASTSHSLVPTYFN